VLGGVEKTVGGFNPPNPPGNSNTAFPIFGFAEICLLCRHAAGVVSEQANETQETERARQANDIPR